MKVQLMSANVFFSTHALRSFPIKALAFLGSNFYAHLMYDWWKRPLLSSLFPQKRVRWCDSERDVDCVQKSLPLSSRHVLVVPEMKTSFWGKSLQKTSLDTSAKISRRRKVLNLG
jgi:hypothetical protein